MGAPYFVGSIGAGAPTGYTISYPVATVALETGAQAGDLLIVFVNHFVTSWFGPAPSPPTITSGWTLLDGARHSSGNPGVYAWGRIIGNPATEPDITVAWGTNAAGVVQIQVWRDGDPAIILDGTPTTGETSTGALTTPETSTSLDGARVIHYTGWLSPSNDVIVGSSPFDTGFDTQFDLSTYGGWILSQRGFSKVQSPAGATTTASASKAGLSPKGVGLLVPLRAGPPRGALTAAATLGASSDAVQADVASSNAPVTAGAAAGWTYLDGVGEGTLLAPATLGAVGDAVQADAGAASAGFTAGSSASVVQAEVGAANAPATIAAASAVVQAEVGAEGETASLGAALDAEYMPPGVVSYPTSDSWQATLFGIGPGITAVTISDSLGSVIVIHLDGGGIVPEPDNALSRLGATAETTYWEPGEEASTARLGSSQDAHQDDRDTVAAAAVLGVAADAEAMPPLVARWLAKAIRVAQSWVGGPYRRIPLDQFAWLPDMAHVLGDALDGNFTPKDAVADIPDAANTYAATQDAAFHIVEPKVIVTVPAIPYGFKVAVIRLGRHVEAIPWVGHAVPPHRLGVAVEAHPYNAVAQARHRR